jgi:ATP-dependent DNA helicase RecG
MNNFVEILMNVAGTIFDRTSMISSFFTDEVCLTVAWSGVIVALALGVIAPSTVIASILSTAVVVDAILKAREEYKKKHTHLTKEVDSWDDTLFLDKAELTIEGKITNTAILLLGKDMSHHLLSPAMGQISWILKYAPEGYEHFRTPFILSIDKTLSCIRNTKYRYMIDETTLFPEEVLHYDEWVMREALNNSIAHQDYSKSSRILVLEYSDRLIFDNAGSFIPDSVEAAIHYDRPQRYYRNPFLITAMVNIYILPTYCAYGTES